MSVQYQILTSLTNSHNPSNSKVSNQKQSNFSTRRAFDLDHLSSGREKNIGVRKTQKLEQVKQQIKAMKEQERKTQSSSRSSIFMSEEGRVVASSDGNHSEYEFSEDEAYDYGRFSLSEDASSVDVDKTLKRQRRLQEMKQEMLKHEIKKTKRQIREQIKEMKEEIVEVLKQEIKEVKEEIVELKHETAEVKHEIAEVKQEIKRVNNKLDQVVQQLKQVVSILKEKT